MVKSLLELDALDVPVLLRVILDRAVGAKLAHLVIKWLDQAVFLAKETRVYGQRTCLGCRPDALLNPLSAIRVCLINHFQCANV